jgi:glycerol-1-phosphatase
VSSPLVQDHDCLLLDLDGTVFRGQQPTEGSVKTLAAVGVRTLFVTNNASRAPGDVAKNLVAMGFTADADDVVTSAQSAARLLATQIGSGSAVLVIGTEALADEVRNVGLRPVRKFADDPVAVVQGHSPETGWSDLAEGALAIRGGALWVAANVDRTLPSELGLLPGNGSMVAALETATDQRPQVAGKPQPPLLLDALARGEFERPLVVGDRLDTDISGANATGLPSLLVLSGVSSAADLVHADAPERPTYVAMDLRALFADRDGLRIAQHPAWRVEIGPDAATVHWTGADAGDSLTIVRAVASAVWDSSLDGRAFDVVGADDTARSALERCSLVRTI